MTTPKDIDGNELRVGDLVEIVPASQAIEASRKYFGQIHVIASLTLDGGGGAYMRGVIESVNLGYGLVWKGAFAFEGLRLIPRDTKAPTKIEFVVTKEGVR
jgi:hypothetical protein